MLTCLSIATCHRQHDEPVYGRQHVSASLQERLIHNGQRGNFFSVPPSQAEATFSGNPQPAFVPWLPANAPVKARSFGRGLLWRLGLSPEGAAASEDGAKVQVH